MQSTSTACSPLLSYTPQQTALLHSTPLSLALSAHCAAHVTFALQQQQQINFNSHLNILQSQRFLTRRSRRQQQRRQLTNKNKHNTKQQQQQQQQANHTKCNSWMCRTTRQRFIYVQSKFVAVPRTVKKPKLFCRYISTHTHTHTHRYCRSVCFVVLSKLKRLRNFLTFLYPTQNSVRHECLSIYLLGVN